RRDLKETVGRVLTLHPIGEGCPPRGPTACRGPATRAPPLPDRVPTPPSPPQQAPPRAHAGAADPGPTALAAARAPAAPAPRRQPHAVAARVRRRHRAPARRRLAALEDPGRRPP